MARSSLLAKRILLAALALALLLLVVTAMAVLKQRRYEAIAGTWYYYDGVCTHFGNLKFEFINQREFIYSNCGTPWCGTSTDASFNAAMGTYQSDGTTIKILTLNDLYPRTQFTITDDDLVYMNVGVPRGSALSPRLIREQPAQCVEDR